MRAKRPPKPSRGAKPNRPSSAHSSLSDPTVARRGWRRWARRVQITGGSTFLITLPKEWSEEFHIAPQAEVQLISPPHRELLMIDPKRQKPTSIGILPLQGDSASAHEAMTRELISLYIAGFDVIEVRGERISAEQRERVRQITQPLGLMVMRDLADLILLHNLLDATRLPVQQTLEQLYANAHSMLADALQSVRQGDRELARGIIARDKDVDCQFLMISRQFHRLLQDPLLAEQIGLSQTQLLHSYEVSRQLERVADHAVKIARQVERIESLRVSVSDTIQQVGASALHLVAEAWTSFSEHDRRRANRVLDECKKFEADALNTLLKHVAKAASPWLSIVADSINRVQDYGANIAETALNAAAAETMLHESLPGR